MLSSETNVATLGGGLMLVTEDLLTALLCCAALTSERVGTAHKPSPVFALAPAAHGRRPRLAINEPSEDRLNPARIAMLAARETLARACVRLSIDGFRRVK